MFQAIILGAAHPHVFDIVRHVTDSTQVQLIGVYDDDPHRTEATAAKLGIRAFASFDQALGTSPALTLIGAVPSQRAALAQRSVAAGAAAIVDKPIAVTHEALDGLIGDVERHAKSVVTYYPYRGTPQVRAAKAELDAGRIGKIVRMASYGPHKLNAPNRPHWHWTRADNGGAIIDIGSHHVDLCCWFARQQPNWIAAQHVNFTQPQFSQFQDFAHAMLRFPGGQVGYVETDWLNPDSMQHFGDTRCWFQGTNGKIEVRLGDEVSAYVWTDQVAAEPLSVDGIPSLNNWGMQLIEDLAAGRTCAIPQEDVWRAARVCLVAFDSAQANGRPIEL